MVISLSRKKDSIKHSSGFTIVELLVVIVVIGILAAIVVVAYNGIQQRAAVAALKVDLKNASTRLELDYVADGVYPATTNLANGGKGLSVSPGTSYQYTTTAQSYCLSATSPKAGSSAANISSDRGSVEDGVCSGHTVPTGGGVVAVSCATGYVVVPGNSLFNTTDFCVMKYEAKNVGGVATSQAAGAPWVSISQSAASTASSAACSGCHLITESEWLTIAHNVLGVASNWSGGTVGSGYVFSGHSDGSPNYALAADSNDSNGFSSTGNSGTSPQRRTLALSNGEIVWDLGANVVEWTSGQVSGGQPGAATATYNFREYTNLSGVDGTMTPNPLPKYGTPASSGWNSAQGIGQIISRSNDATTRGIMRGSAWSYGSTYSGIFTLIMGNTPTAVDPEVGFRVAK